MDEPFAAVDAQTRAELEDLVRALWSRLGVTTLFVTHDIDEAVYLGQRVLVLSARPTVVVRDIEIDLPAELRAEVYELIQRAKHHEGSAAELDTADEVRPGEVRADEVRVDA